MNGFLDDLKNTLRQQDNALVKIILINVLVFITLNVLETIMIVFFGAKGLYDIIESQLLLPASVPQYLNKPWTIITYFFVHKGLLHILFNMLFMYWFGRLVVEYLGSRRVISLYVLGGIVGGLFYMIMYNFIPYYSKSLHSSEMLGASAGVYAVVVGAATLLPNYTFHLLFIGPVRIKYIALFYILLSFFELKAANAGGDIAHLGGALLGYIFIIQLRNGRDLGKTLNWMLESIAGFFNPKPKLKVTQRQKSKVVTNTAVYKNAKSTSSIHMPDQDEIDAILDKISVSGYDSLTKEEKQKLFNASKN